MSSRATSARRAFIHGVLCGMGALVVTGYLISSSMSLLLRQPSSSALCREEERGRRDVVERRSIVKTDRRGDPPPCRVQHAKPCDLPWSPSRARFEKIYSDNVWGGDANTRSGPGSTIVGALEWVIHLDDFMQTHNIRTVADVPSTSGGNSPCNASTLPTRT